MCITFTFRLLPLLLRHGFIIVPPEAAHIDMKLSTKWWKRGYCDSDIASNVRIYVNIIHIFAYMAMIRLGIYSQLTAVEIPAIS